MFLHVSGCTVYTGDGYVFLCTSTADKLHSVSDKDPDGSKVLERYVESLNSEIKAEKNRRFTKLVPTSFNITNVSKIFQESIFMFHRPKIFHSKASMRKTSRLLCSRRWALNIAHYLLLQRFTKQQ